MALRSPPSGFAKQPSKNETVNRSVPVQVDGGEVSTSTHDRHFGPERQHPLHVKFRAWACAQPQTRACLHDQTRTDNGKRIKSVERAEIAECGIEIVHIEVQAVNCRG